MRAIQFETAVNGNTILIPEQFIKILPPHVSVTLIPVDNKAKFKSKIKDTPSSINEFPAILNTAGFKFNREDANER